jgi:hypothetical protein
VSLQVLFRLKRLGWLSQLFCLYGLNLKRNFGSVLQGKLMVTSFEGKSSQLNRIQKPSLTQGAQSLFKFAAKLRQLELK